MVTKKSAKKTAAARKSSTKPAKKTAPKTTAKSKSSAAAKSTQTKATTHETSSHTPERTSAPTTTTGERKSRGFRIKKSYLILAGTILALGALLYLTRGLFVAAVVNGQPISRLSVVQEAEKQAGPQVMQRLIRDTLIEQEARKQNVSVSEKEIDDEIKKLEENLQKQGQKLDQVLSLQGMDRKTLRGIIRTNKLVEKMVGKDIKITDQQINDYLEKNKDTLPQDQDQNQLKATVKEQLTQQQLNEKVRTWLEGLQKNAKINQIVKYPNQQQPQ